MNVKSGSTRVVVILRTVVIKIPKNTFGFKCNRREWDNYRFHNTGYYAKTYFSFPFGLLNVMQRADRPRNFKNKIKERYYQTTIKDNVYSYSVDDCLDNYGFVDRHLVLVDYA